MHNNRSELALRGPVVGRKAWLFAGSEGGAHAAATFFTLTGSCAMQGIDPWPYFADVLSRINDHPVNRIAELTSWNPARRFGLKTKGDIAPGFDADIALVDTGRSFMAGGKASESDQGYSVFEGMEMSATVTSTFLRGHLVYDQGKPVGGRRGQYLHRPYG